MADVRAARETDVPVLARALAQAFERDPVFGWLLPAGNRFRRLERFFVLELAHVVLPAGTAYTTDGLPGAALTLPPDRWRMPISQQIRHAPAFARVFGRRLPLALALLTRMEARHLREPHVYFPYIGVEPARQGQGLGAALMAEPLAQTLPAYLEATSPDNARLYRRLGFVDIETVTVAGSPPLALMRRDPV